MTDDETEVDVDVNWGVLGYAAIAIAVAWMKYRKTRRELAEDGLSRPRMMAVLWMAAPLFVISGLFWFVLPFVALNRWLRRPRPGASFPTVKETR